MRYLAFILVSLTSLSTLASPLTSKALEGEYSLTKDAVGRCHQNLSITVQKEGISVESNGSYVDFFSADKEGCKSAEGDIGPIRNRCTDFSKNSVSYSDSQPISIVGYIKEKDSFKLSNKGQKLVYTRTSTVIPFGILGIFDDGEFNCIYERIK